MYFLLILIVGVTLCLYSLPFIFAGRMLEGANSLEFKVNRVVYSHYTKRALGVPLRSVFAAQDVSQLSANCVALSAV